MNYQDMIIEAYDSSVVRDPATKQRQRSFKVRVLRSPAGEMAAGRAITSQCDEAAFQTQLRALDARELDREGLFNLGRLLGLLLLPAAQKDGDISVRELFTRSLEKVGADSGLRLRLQMAPELSAFPWEYIYLDRTGSEGDSMLGFLALDPRISIIRHEALPVAPATTKVSGEVKVLAALASPDHLEPLNLKVEAGVLHQALDGQPGIALTVCENATMGDVQNALGDAHVFHFAGHGRFLQRAGDQPGTVTGRGEIALDDGNVDAEQLGVNLRSQGVRLAMLGACETGRRTGAFEWQGVAPALARADVPAIIANQYSILDQGAIAFSGRLYSGLTGGLSIESAVQAGRLAIYNADQTGRDWGAPVLYLRAADGALFEGAVNKTVRAEARSRAEAEVKVRAREVAQGGFVTGAAVKKFVAGKLNVNVVIDEAVHGDVRGLDVGEFGSGAAHVSVGVDSVKPGGSVTGAVFKNFGATVEKKSVPTRRRATRAKPSKVEASVTVGTVQGGSVVGTQHNDHSVGGDKIDVATGGHLALNKAIDGQNVQIGSVIINQGGAAVTSNDRNLIEEQMRLDVALPKTVVVEEAFDVVVQVRQPASPPLSVADLDQVVSASGSVFRAEESDVIRYRVAVSGDGFRVDPPHYLLKLRPKQDSQAVTFQVTSTKAGKRTLIVNAFQDDKDDKDDDDVVVAQTRLTIKATVAIIKPS